MSNEDSHSYNQLLEAISHGNERAFSIFYDLFATELTRHIFSKVNDQEVAEDILHDLFLSLWKNKSRLTEIISVPAYLYSSCRYLIIAYSRKKYSKPTLQLDISSLDILDEDVPLEDRLYYRYTLDLIEKEIENLPEKCREVFKLSRSEFLSNREIAQKLQISESTVEKHINKAIKRLRSLTQPYLLIL
ncbi:RNA polymerase sigma factor [Sphingobacterium hotanense]|nr:sigma-70 family RNA polymerase sigma factor [Sphingobacterium hotanense]